MKPRRLKLMYRSVQMKHAPHKGFAIMPVLSLSALATLAGVITQTPALHGAN